MNNYRDVYEKYLKTPEWAAKREQVLERDARRCRACNSPEKLEVHHRTYARLEHEDLNDLTTLCESCHEHFHRKMKQDEIMARTYSAPRTEPELTPLERERIRVQQWEDFLIGMLILDPTLSSHVAVVFSEENFAGEETRALYRLLVTSHSRSQLDQSFEQMVPPELMSVVARCTEVAKEEVSPQKAVNIKNALLAATRLKRMALLRGNRKLKELLDASYASGDVAEMRRLMKQKSASDDQLRMIDIATDNRGQ